MRRTCATALAALLLSAPVAAETLLIGNKGEDSLSLVALTAIWPADDLDVVVYAGLAGGILVSLVTAGLWVWAFCGFPRTCSRVWAGTHWPCCLRRAQW